LIKKKFFADENTSRRTNPFNGDKTAQWKKCLSEDNPRKEQKSFNEGKSDKRGKNHTTKNND
jgi:hypothetical protein